MVLALDPSGVFEFRLAEDRGDDPNATVWILRVLEPRDRAAMLFALMKMQVATDIERIVEGLQIGIAGFRNLCSRATNGELVPVECRHEQRALMGSSVKREVLAESVVKLIPTRYWTELAAAILNGNELDSDDRKNSP